jgi:DNA-binding CsgD family transcriptional regulator
MRLRDDECVIDPTIVARLVKRARPARQLAVLTDREREVLALMAEGRSNKAICAQLFLSPKTVEAHVKHIFMKLGINESRTTIAACARCWPICAPDLATDGKAGATRRRSTFVPLPVLQVDNEPRVRDGYISLDTRRQARTRLSRLGGSICRKNVTARAQPCPRW